jgi:predicted Rossmann fold flavoprotein
MKDIYQIQAMPKTEPNKRRIVIIGGGAAGFFAAVTAAESNPQASVLLFEKGKHFLQKVKISGGGRCNVTHSCFDPAELAAHYPRGSRELRAAFHRWQPRDTIAWFEERGVTIKREADGRMFPVTDDSQTIIDCLRGAARELGVKTQTQCGLKKIAPGPDHTFQLTFENHEPLEADAVCIAVGSLKNSALANDLEALNHEILPLAPSLFAFNVNDSRLHDLAGLSVPQASVEALPLGKPQIGPLLITHRGLSGPAILRASAWGAREIQATNYHFEITVNWLGECTEKELRAIFMKQRQDAPRKAIKNTSHETIPRRLWERLVQHAGIDESTPWAQLSKKQENALLQECLSGRYQVQGKTTNKDEFVTCGGVSLKAIDFRRMESKRLPGLHFAGECLDFDGITGGFNFQAAWTTGRIAGESMAED